MESVVDRFLRYAQIDTQSVEAKHGEEKKHPSSHGQIELGNLLKQEIQEMGIPLITNLPDGYFIVELPATDESLASAPVVGFAAHLDTYPEFSGKVMPMMHDYQGGSIIVGKNEKGAEIIIEAADLVGLEGKTIITANGTSLLGADDKGGIATIMEVLSCLASNKVSHGPLIVIFCTDEETGSLNVDILPKEIIESLDVLWTIDGERLGKLDVGSFIGRKVVVIFNGEDAHPGVYGDKLKPAQYAAVDFVAELAKLPTPMNTSDDQGFCYVTKFEGTATQATVTCIPRYFSSEDSEKMGATIKQFARKSAEKYRVTVEIPTNEVQYLNTADAIKSKMHLVQPGIMALESMGVTVELQNIRGGTDGGMLNMVYPNLPAPNLGYGGANFHGPREFLVKEELEMAPLVVLKMIKIYSQVECLSA